jgi:acyl-CoA synthetase (AMP-forming)/AMP-acid ligase II
MTSTVATGLQENESLAATLSRVLSSGSEELAIAFGDRRHSWRAVGALASQLRDSLDSLGVAQHARVGIVARSRPSHVAAVWGLLAAERCATMIYGFQAPGRIAEDIADLRAPLLLIDREDWAAPLAEAARAAGSAVLLLDEMSLAAPDGFGAIGPAANRAGLPGIALQTLSSGTTGKPKRIDLTATTVANAARAAAHQLKGLAGHSATPPPTISIFPLCNISGLYSVIPHGLIGRPIAMLEKFALDPWVDLVRRYRPLGADLPPAAIAMILAAEVPPEDLASLGLVRSGAAPLDPALHAEFEARYGTRIVLSYGASEFCGIVTTWTPDDIARFHPERRFSAGRAIAGVAIRTRDAETGELLGPDRTGLLEVRADRVGPDWIRTNDLVSIDADGFLWFKGRADGAIMRGGFKIVPDTVEDALRRHPAIADAIVVGLADARLGAVPAAVVQAAPGGPAPSETEVLAWAHDHLAAFQVPVRVQVVAELPRTPSMKPSRDGARLLLEAGR